MNQTAGSCVMLHSPPKDIGESKDMKVKKTKKEISILEEGNDRGSSCGQSSKPDEAQKLKRSCNRGGGGDLSRSYHVPRELKKYQTYSSRTLDKNKTASGIFNIALQASTPRVDENGSNCGYGNDSFSNDRSKLSLSSDESQSSFDNDDSSIRSSSLDESVSSLITNMHQDIFRAFCVGGAKTNNRSNTSRPSSLLVTKSYGNEKKSQRRLDMLYSLDPELESDVEDASISVDDVFFLQTESNDSNNDTLKKSKGEEVSSASQTSSESDCSKNKSKDEKAIRSKDRSSKDKSTKDRSTKDRSSVGKSRGTSSRHLTGQSDHSRSTKVGTDRKKALQKEKSGRPSHSRHTTEAKARRSAVPRSKSNDDMPKRDRRESVPGSKSSDDIPKRDRREPVPRSKSNDGMPKRDRRPAVPRTKSNDDMPKRDRRPAVPRSKSNDDMHVIDKRATAARRRSNDDNKRERSKRHLVKNPQYRILQSENATDQKRGKRGKTGKLPCREESDSNPITTASRSDSQTKNDPAVDSHDYDSSSAVESNSEDDNIALQFDPVKGEVERVRCLDIGAGEIKENASIEKSDNACASSVEQEANDACESSSKSALEKVDRKEKLKASSGSFIKRMNKSVDDIVPSSLFTSSSAQISMNVGMKKKVKNMYSGLRLSISNHDSHRKIATDLSEELGSRAK